MSQDMRLHIFDRFYQGDPSHTTEGNGIGLTVVDKIVRLHKGYVAVGSEEGIGTTFTVTLPESSRNFTSKCGKTLSYIVYLNGWPAIRFSVF